MLEMNDYGVEIIAPYGTFRVGQVVYPPYPFRDRMLSSGVARRRSAIDEMPTRSPNQSKPVLKLK